MLRRLPASYPALLTQSLSVRSSNPRQTFQRSWSGRSILAEHLLSSSNNPSCGLSSGLRRLLPSRTVDSHCVKHSSPSQLTRDPFLSFLRRTSNHGHENQLRHTDSSPRSNRLSESRSLRPRLRDPRGLG